MTDNVILKETLHQNMLSLIKKFAVTVIASFLFSIIFHNIWVRDIDVYHTILEGFCIFIALTIFLSVWYTYPHHGATHYILGFGYLGVGVFDALHTFYNLKLNLNQDSYFDMSSRFWIIGRIAEALTLFFSIRNYRKIKNKWIALFITLGFSAVIFVVALYYHDVLPVLLTAAGVTPFKVFLEYSVIFIYCITLFVLKGHIGRESDNLTYPYIVIAILTGILAEFMFTLYTSVSSVAWMMGHILKIAAYFYLLHGIFISSIIYPYKKLEQEHHLLEEKNETLIRDQEKLLQQEKLALLGQMGAGIVHETRNYLTTIKGSSQLIIHLSHEEKIRQYARNIDQNINEVNKIISEFLFLSKPKETELTAVPLSHIISAIKSMVETASMLKGIPVEFNISKKERSLVCDESQLKQVILNLCKNAAEAMIDRTDAKLVIETGLLDDINEMYIRISDNGKGISEENLKKLGTPFFTSKKSGTGLGLCVCYKIIQNHKGRIEVQSKLNIGTTFTIYLPSVRTEEDFSAPAVASH